VVRDERKIHHARSEAATLVEKVRSTRAGDIRIFGIRV
jgi:hypothetical protein